MKKKAIATPIIIIIGVVLVFIGVYMIGETFDTNDTKIKVVECKVDSDCTRSYNSYWTCNEDNNKCECLVTEEQSQDICTQGIEKQSKEICGNGICEGSENDEYCGSQAGCFKNCVQDCEPISNTPICGDGICDEGEEQQDCTDSIPPHCQLVCPEDCGNNEETASEFVWQFLDSNNDCETFFERTCSDEIYQGVACEPNQEGTTCYTEDRCSPLQCVSLSS